MIPQFSPRTDRQVFREVMKKIPFKTRIPLVKKCDIVYKKLGRYSSNSTFNALKLFNVFTDRGYDNDISGTYARVQKEAAKNASICSFILTDCSSVLVAFKAWYFAQNELTVELMPSYPDMAENELIEHLYLKLGSEKFWSRALKIKHNRALENASRDINLVNKLDGVYVSNENLRRYVGQQNRNVKSLENTNIVNELGDKLTLKEAADKTVSNPVNRRHELNTRIAGMGEYAKKNGYVADFWTVTAPSRMHSSNGKTGYKLSTYDGTTSRECQQFLTKTFSQLRSSLDRHGIVLNGLRIVEPHKDGSAHWHALLFFKDNKSRNIARMLARDCFMGWIEPRFTSTNKQIKGTGCFKLQYQGWEDGAKENRFLAVCVRMDDQFSAVGYITKYISKNVDGFALQADMFKENTPAMNALRTKAWASTHGIRQFQFLGSESVTVWRELRRIKSGLKVDSVFFDAWQAASIDGDWCAFTEAMEKTNIKPFSIDSDKNRYGLPVTQKIIGLICGDEFLKTHFHEWKIEEKKDQFFIDVESKDYGVNLSDEALENFPVSYLPTGFEDHKNFYEDDFYYELKELQKSVAPWSSVNNCTEAIKENVRE